MAYHVFDWGSAKLGTPTTRDAPGPPIRGLSLSPICHRVFLRKQGYRFTLLYKCPSLQVVDAKEVSPEERERALNFFNPEYPQYNGGLPPNVVAAPNNMMSVNNIAYGSGSNMVQQMVQSGMFSTTNGPATQPTAQGMPPTGAVRPA